MIKQKSFGPVNQYIMGRLIEGQLLFFMACYYVDGLLIDSEPAHAACDLMQTFKYTPVKIIVNTHHHEDHIGNNAWFQKNKICGPALAHELAVPIIRKSSTIRLPAYRERIWGVPPDSLAEKIGPEVKTENYCFKVLSTPGHSRDHISLLETQQGWLFGGDLFIAIEAKHFLDNEDPNVLINSLREILNHDFRTLFCASGAVLEKHAKQAVKKKIAFLEDIKENVHYLNTQGYTPEEIREQLLGKETSRYFRSEGEFGKIHLVNAFLNRKN